MYSTFIPTCSECSTTQTSPGVTSVRGASSIAFCRECHRKMSTPSSFPLFQPPVTHLLSLQDP